MKISVVIPVYNNIDIIDELKQRLLSIAIYNEILLIDDCSTDSTYEEIIKLKEKNNLSHLKIFRNDKNRGPSFSRNKGIKNAIGEYIAFLDSDDDWHPQKLELQIALMEQTGTKICGTMHKVIDKDSLEDEKNIKYSIEKIKYISIKWPKILFKTPFATPSVIIHKSIKDFLFDESMKYAEDYNLWKRVTYFNPGIKILEPLTYTFKHDYLSNNSSLSSNLKKMQEGVEESFLKLLKDKKILLKDKFLIVFALIFSKLKYIRRVIKSKRV
ncbi:glycosyltransferase family 2 protein [Halarcobacter ebronensis]|nr:glycosyltransferase family 2 protein [Halarcobacter ebronensis]